MSKRKLLLADDSITIQKVVNLTFADEGIEVISVGDGDSAMEKFNEFLPDLVMADVNMPGLNGYEICQIIKQNDDTRTIPVILLVGSFEPFDEAEASRVGADDFLTKPFQSIRQLVNKVNDLLSRDASVSEVEQSEPENVPQVDTFAETLAIDNQEETPTEFGDAGMDDEMIETSPANDFVSESNSDYQAETTIDYAKTQPLNADDLKGFSIVSDTETAEEETEEALQDSVEEQESVEEMPESEVETSEIAEQETGFIEPETFEDSETTEDSETFENGEFEDDESKIESVSETELNYYSPTVEENTETETSDSQSEEENVEVESSDYESSEQETLESEISEVETTESADETVSEDLSETESFDEDEDETEESETTETEESEDSETEELQETEVSEESEAALTSEAEEIEESSESESELVEEETQIPAQEVEEETQVPTQENVPALSFDDGDLLELPPLVEETGIRPLPVVQEAKTELSSEPESVTETEAEPQIEAVETQPIDEVMQSFPPELIDAIAQKVAEKFSDQAIKDIAWEIVPQMTEMIIKKMAEEKLKDKK